MNKKDSFSPVFYTKNLSHSQKRMWFLNSFYPGNSAYNINLVVELQGDLNIRALEKSLKFIVERHEILRSEYCLIGHEPILRIYKKLKVNLDKTDLTSFNLDTQDDKIKIIQKYLSIQFDLDQAPLFRFILLRTSKNSYIFIVVLHHIIADGWSLDIIYRELSELYNAFSNNKMPNLAQVKYHYHDCINNYTTEIFTDGIQYWKNKLKDLPTLALPTLAPRSPEQLFSGSSETIFIPEDIAVNLEKLAREQGVTLFILMLSAYIILLQKYTNQNDIVLGTPVANRINEEEEEIIGLFVNSLVLRVEILPTQKIIELIKNIRNNILSDFEHQHVPFEILVEELQPERSLNFNPLFQAMFALQSATTESFKFQGLEVKKIDPNTTTTRFDTEFTLWRKKTEGIKLRFNYNNTIFNKEFSIQFLEHYKLILEIMLNNINEVLSNIQLSDPNLEKYTQVHPNIDFSSYPNTLHELFQVCANINPNKLAIISDGIQLTYQELDMLSNMYAKRILKDSQCLNNQLIGICTERTVEMIIAILSVWKAGAGVVGINPDDTTSRIKYIVEDAQIKLIICTNDTYKKIASLDYNVIIISNKDKQLIDEEQNIDVSIKNNPSDIAYMIYTSGTTGNPKGVIVEHCNVVNTLLGCRDVFQFNDKDIFACVSSFTFDIFYFELFSPLISCGTSILVTKEELFNPDKMIIILQKATCIQAVPGLMQQFINILEERDILQLPNFRQVTTGGDVVPPSLLNKMKKVFCNAEVTVTYGPTEAAILSTRFIVQKNATIIGYPIGIPLPNVKIQILDSYNNLVPCGVIGEIHIGGAGVTRGYLNLPEETKQKFVIIKGERFYKTGDYAKWLFDGNIEFIGRLDNQVKLRGFRIETSEIESILCQYPDVKESSVILAEYANNEKKLCAFITLNNNKLLEDKQKEDSYISSWQQLFNQAHELTYNNINLTKDFTGWNSVYTGEPLPQDEMLTWLYEIKNTIINNLPKDKIQQKSVKILEIGCGTGLILFEIAPFCLRYDAVDFSETVIKNLQNSLGSTKLNNVHLYTAEAINFSSVIEKGMEYDMVIINSVIQYFPDVEYLNKLLDLSILYLGQEGKIIIGDIRNYALKEALYASIEVNRMKGNFTKQEIRRRCLARVNQEQELLIHPKYFYLLYKLNKNLSSIRIIPKIPIINNELFKYRYNVIITLGKKPDYNKVIEELNWYHDSLSTDKVLSSLSTGNKEYLLIRNIPNITLTEDLSYVSWAYTDDNLINIDVYKENCNVNLMKFIKILEKKGYCTDLNLSITKSNKGTIDLLIYKIQNTSSLEIDWYGNIISSETEEVSQSNIPIQIYDNTTLLYNLKKYLHTRLPDYMIPSVFKIIPQLPLTLNNKVDREKLKSIAYNLNISSKDLVLPRNNVEKIIYECWKDILNLDNISILDNFFEIGGTSLLAIQVTILLRKNGIKIKPQDIFRYKVIAELAEVVNIIDTTEDQNINYTKSIAVLDSNKQYDKLNDKVIFIVGATGYLGVHLLREILINSNSNIICLIRLKNGIDSSIRLQQLFNWYFEEDLKSYSHRIKIVNGDLTKPRLGLESNIWEEIAKTCTLIINSAADVRHVAEEQNTYFTNYYAVKELLTLAQEYRAKILHHVSTIGVKGLTGLDSQCNIFREQDLEVGQILTEPYSESKFKAELEIRKFIAQGGKSNVYRVGTISPHSVTGRFQKNIEGHFFTRYLHSIIKLGIAPYWDKRMLYLTPVDSIARAILTLGNLDLVNNTYHIMTEHSLSYYDVTKFLQNYGFPIRVIQADEFEKKIFTLNTDKTAIESLSGILQLLDNKDRKHIPLSCEYTHNILKQTGFYYPKITSEWMVNFFNHCIKVSFIPEPKYWMQVDTIPDIITNV